jgi:hypothetical protein
VLLRLVVRTIIDRRYAIRHFRSKTVAEFKASLRELGTGMCSFGANKMDLGQIASPAVNSENSSRQPLALSNVNM